MTIFSSTIEKQCQLTGRSFPVSDREKALYEGFGIPAPVVAPEERLRRLYAFVPGTELYVRECDYTHQRIASAYTYGSPFPVYEPEYWATRAWNPQSLGQPFQFKRLFMEQFLELWRNIPRPAVDLAACPSGIIANTSTALSDCYSVYQSESVTRSSYCVRAHDCSDCYDCYECDGCGECYEGVFLLGCHRLFFSESCVGCTDSCFLSDCIDCKHCFGCTHLRGARYHVFNQPVSREEYQAVVSGFDIEARPLMELTRNRFRELLAREPIPWIFADHSSANSGNYLRNTQLCVDSFFCSDAVDLVNCAAGTHSRTVLDSVLFSKLENCASVVSCNEGRDLLCCISCRDGVERLSYCSHCERSADLFGCIGLSGMQYCVFNTQFSADEYRALRTRIEEHMRQRGIWGSLFPPGFSGVAYNRSFAGILMPLTKIPAKMMNFPWDETDEQMTRPSALVGEDLETLEALDEKFHEVPNRTGEISEDNISRMTFLCAITGQPFHISPAEHRFLLRHRLPLPECSFQHRHAMRVAQCTPYIMSQRSLGNNSRTVRTSVPERWKRPLGELT